MYVCVCVCVCVYKQIWSTSDVSGNVLSTWDMNLIIKTNIGPCLQEVYFCSGDSTKKHAN